MTVLSDSSAPGQGCREKDCRWEGLSFPQGRENLSPRMAGYGEEPWDMKLTEEKLEIC